jgi:cell division protein FtsB
MQAIFLGGGLTLLLKSIIIRANRGNSSACLNTVQHGTKQRLVRENIALRQRVSDLMLEIEVLREGTIAVAQFDRQHVSWVAQPVRIRP